MTDQTPASEPVTFAPGKIVRLTRPWWGHRAGTEGMLSGEVLTRPEDKNKLVVIINPADPGARDYARLVVPRDALRYTNRPCQCPTCKRMLGDLDKATLLTRLERANERIRELEDALGIQAQEHAATAPHDDDADPF